MQSQVMNNESKQMGKAYRQFSRRRYKEMKNSLPTVRESQIVQMIIREWDSIPMIQKNKLCSGRNSDLLSTPAKIEEDMVRMDLKNKSNAKTTGRKTKQEEVDIKSNSDHISDQINSNQALRSNNANPMTVKTKAIKKSSGKSLKSGDYITFYKTHYKTIMENHPNWTSNQASLIISLMWRKNKKAVLSKKSVISSVKKPLRMSGRMLFGKLKRKQGLNTMMVKRMWRRLPFETKVMWAHQGNPQRVQMKKNLTMRVPFEKMEGEGLKMLMNAK